MTSIDETTWTLAARGSLGDTVYWQPQFKPIGEARSLLCLLEEIGKDSVDWKPLLAGLPRLQALQYVPFPPLYSERDFDSICGFLTVEDEPSLEAPGFSYNTIEIYVAREDAPELLREFSELISRLRSYEPLEPYIYL